MSDSKHERNIWDLMKGADAEGTRAWLRRHPSQLDECVRARGAAMPPPLGPEELSELRAFHERCGADAASLAALEHLASPNTRVVVAGQQPGLLAGPLYSLYKAIGAILLARQLAERHPGVHFVPVFWIASEDHDFQEIRRAHWPGSAGELEEVLIEHPDWSPGRMIGSLPSAPILPHLLGRIESTTFETEFRARLLDQLREAYAEGEDFERSFCRLLLGLLRGLGLVVVSPLMRWVRARSVPILRSEALGSGASTRRLLERAATLEHAGFEATLHRRDDAINFFWLDEKERRHSLALDSGRVLGAISGQNLPDRQLVANSVSDLVSMLETSPGRFSLNVVTRPLVQDSILPTVAQLVGPGEAAYLAMVESVYEDFGVFAPVRYPRPTVTLVDNAAGRILKKYDLSTDTALNRDAGELTRLLAERASGSGIVQEARDMRDRQRAEIQALRDRLGNDPPSVSALEKLVQVMEKGYATLEDRLLYSRQRDEGHVAQAMARLANVLNPAGRPQERVLNPLVPFALNYGPDWALRLASKLTIDPGIGMQIHSLADLR